MCIKKRKIKIGKSHKNNRVRELDNNSLYNIYEYCTYTANTLRGAVMCS